MRKLVIASGPDRRHRPVRGLDGVATPRAASQAARGRVIPSVEGRWLRTHPGDRPGRPDAAGSWPTRPARAAPASGPGGAPDTRPEPGPSSARPPGPAVVLKDASGQTRDLRGQLADGPVVVVFYLGARCMACVTHLVELDAALPRFRERGAVSGRSAATTPEVSRAPRRRFGEFAIPLAERPGPRRRHGLRRLEADPGRRDRTTARPCTAPSSSIATARSAGPTSGIARSPTSRRCWRNWTGRAGVSANPGRGVSRNGYCRRIPSQRRSARVWAG